MGEEAPVGHVLAERDPVDLLVPGHQRPVGPEGHHLVEEGSVRHRLGHTDHQGGPKCPGQPRQHGLFGGVGQHRVEGHHVLGPQDQLRWAVVVLEVLGGRHLGGQHRCRIGLRGVEAPRSTALDRCGGDRSDRAASVGAVVAGYRQADHQRHRCHPDHGRPAPSGHRSGQHTHRRPAAVGVPSRVDPGEDPRPPSVPQGTPHRPDQGGQPDAAGIDQHGQAQRTAEPGHAEHRSVRLSEEHAADGQPTERPVHAGRLGQGHRRRKGQGPGPHRAGGDGQAACGEKGRLHHDEHDGTGDGEGPGPGQPGEIEADPGQPAAPPPGRWSQPAEPPPQQAGRGEGQDPKAPGRKGEGQADTRGQSGKRHHPPAGGGTGPRTAGGHGDP